MAKSQDRNFKDARVVVVSDFINADIWRVCVHDIRWGNYDSYSGIDEVSVASYVGKGARTRALAHAKRIRKALKVLPTRRTKSYDAEVAGAVIEAMDAMSPQRQQALVRKLIARWGKERNDQ